MPGMIYEPRPVEHVPGDCRDPHREERMNPTSHPRCIALIAIAALMAAITAAATAIPAWRASRLKPSGVLHAD